MNQEYKIKRQIKKEEKRKRREQLKRRAKIKKIFVPIITFVAIQMFLVSLFSWGFWDWREMNDENTVQLTDEIDYIDFWNPRAGSGSIHGEIVIGNKTYKFSTTRRYLKGTVDSIDELKNIKNDTNITVTVSKDGNEVVGLKSDSKIYYDMDEQYNIRAYQKRVALIILICFIEPAIIILYLLYFFGPEILSSIFKRKNTYKKLYLKR